MVSPVVALRLALMECAHLFEGLGPEDRRELAHTARDTRVPRRETFFREGDPSAEVIVLGTGRVKITQVSAAGLEVILRLAGPGDVVGGLWLESEDTHVTTAEALEPSHGLAWSRETLDRAIDRLPRLRRNVLTAASERHRDLRQRFMELATEKVGQRLARALVRLGEQIGRPYEGGTRIDLSREELAQTVGTTLFTVSRLLSQWEASGLLRTRREAVVLDDVPCLLRAADELPPLCSLTAGPLPVDCPLLDPAGSSPLNGCGARPAVPRATGLPCPMADTSPKAKSLRVPQAHRKPNLFRPVP